MVGETSWLSGALAALKEAFLPRRLAAAWITCLLLLLLLVALPNRAVSALGLEFFRRNVGVIAVGFLFLLLLWIFELPSSGTFQNRRLDRTLREDIREHLEEIAEPEKRMLWTIYNERRTSVELSILDETANFLCERGLLELRARKDRNLTGVYRIPPDVLREMKGLAKRDARWGRGAT